jgi:hypothetical protein
VLPDTRKTQPTTTFTAVNLVSATPPGEHPQPCPKTPAELRDQIVPLDRRSNKFRKPKIKWHFDSRAKEWGKPPSMTSMIHWEASNMNHNSRWLTLIYFPVQQFLSLQEESDLHIAYPALHPLFANSPIPPLRPHLYQRKVSFGKDRIGISATTSTVNFNLLLHFAYDFLTIEERQVVFAKAVPQLHAYVQLRRGATFTSVHYLRTPRNLKPIQPALNDKRIYNLAHALLRFNFEYPDLVRWLGGHTHMNGEIGTP